MKARLEVATDTIWTNAVVASVECELDTPHVLTAQMLAEMMVHRLNYLVEEIRHANERAALQLQMAARDDEKRDRPPIPEQQAAGGEPERERQAYEEMMKEREGRERSIFEERRDE